ncbi:MAG TPA: ATP-dependent Clp protease adaptor ClpS [Longimicrobium sp.]|nr:ATP-dependent Clp protease adaptor ClpS [Longimicrobium sp.]
MPRFDRAPAVAELRVYQVAGPIGRPRAALPGQGDGGDDDRRRGREHQEDVAVAERPKTRKPRLYRVLLHNDDFTPMEFVIEVLVRHFDKSPTEATRVMLQVHHLGVGVAGVYTRDEAETRIDRVTHDAESSGYPLLLTMEPE